MNQEIKNQIELAIQDLYADDQYKLKQICNREMAKFGGLSQKDYDGFYSRAGKEIAVAIRNEKYDPFIGKTPLDFFTGVVRQSVYKEMTDRNRLKRQLVIESNEEDENGNIVKKKRYIPTSSIDTPIGDDDGITIGDTLQSDFDMGNEIEKELKNERIEKFLENLPKTQRLIAEMIMDDFSISDIKKELNLSDKKYTDNFNALKSFKNINILCNNANQAESKEDDFKMSTTTQTMENCKTDRISIASIIKKIDKHTIRFDHPLQRESDQWTPSMKGNLVSDILQGNKLHPLIFAEQIINGVPIIWDLDGKQRCTNAYAYSKNGYKVSKNIRRWMIKYQTTKKDDDGNDILDDNGFPIAVNAEFDIRGKKFSDLPEELKDRFLDYSFNYDQYLNCSEEDIGYHIERYNDGKPMTVSQKGITKLGTEYAEIVKSISNMPFFKDMGGYKVSEYKNGIINRVVVESVMASYFFEDWKEKQDYLCGYLKDNATVTDFDNFEDMVERLEKVVTDDVANMFDSKDSFLWFGLFARFVNTGEDDKKYVEFMTEFARSLHMKNVNGTTYDELCINKKTGKTRATKDKYIVVPKMEVLEKLMKEFLGINESDDVVVVNTETFIAEHVDIPLEDVVRDIDCYESTLNDLEDSTIKDGSKLLDTDNRLSMLAMVAYSFKNEVDLDSWMTEYAKNNNTYFVDQKKNYLHMKNDFDQYLKKCA